MLGVQLLPACQETNRSVQVSQTLSSALPNGLHLVAIPMPWCATVSLSVFVRTGSLQVSSARLAGISHPAKHIASRARPRVRTSRQPIQRQQPHHMPNRHAGLASFDAPDGLHMHAQPGCCGRLTFAGL